MILWREKDNLTYFRICFFSLTFSCKRHIKWCCNINVEYAMKFLLRIVNKFWLFYYNNQLSQMTSTFPNCRVIEYVCEWFQEDAVIFITHSLATYLFVTFEWTLITDSVLWPFFHWFNLPCWSYHRQQQQKTSNIYHKIVGSMHFARLLQQD